MTAVVGILNKRGVAIAADSAVTRTRYDKAKVTKNGNKMIRMSNAVPISVMITGNAAFMGNPWGVVVRCYRRDRGDISHPTVEACARDLFDYMVSNEQLWSAKYTEMLIADILQSIFSEVEELVAPSVCERCLESRDYTLSKSYLGNFLKRLKKFRDAELAKGVCPQFEGYTIESFRTIAQPILQKWIAEKSDESKIELPYPEQFCLQV